MSFLAPMSWGLPEQPWQTRRLLTQRGAAGSTACASPSRGLAKVPLGFAQRGCREVNAEHLPDGSEPGFPHLRSCRGGWGVGGGESGELRHSPLV